MTDKQDNAKAIWQTRLRELEPAAVLVDARLLRRVARMVQGISVFSGRVPHSTVLVLARDRLPELAAEDELGIQHFGELPEHVMLVAWPGDGYQDTVIAQLLAGRLVHGWTHLYWLTVPDLSQRLGRRLQQLGQCEWEEILAVAAQDRWLQKRVSEEEAVYREFVAYWWELRWVYPERLPIWFPTLALQINRIDSVVSQDVDGRPWQHRLHQAGLLPNQTNEPESRSVSIASVHSDPNEPVFVAQREAVQTIACPDTVAPALEMPHTSESGASFGEPISRRWSRIAGLVQRGNLVRAARLCWLDAQRAESTSRSWWQEQARQLICQLAERLARTLASDHDAPEHFDAPKSAWRDALWPLLPPAAAGLFSQEARLLYDLQRVSEDARQGVYVVDLAGWLRTLGLLAWRRQQPLLQQFVVLRRLRAALHRIPLCSLSLAQRELLTHLVESAIEQQEQSLRNAVVPQIRQVLQEVRLVPRNLSEQIEQERLVQTLADRVVENGHLTIGQLRDAISSNQLKVPDLNGLGEWWRGDPLLTADRRLSLTLDGMYRRGEVYLRWFQRLSSIFFGTRLGRWFSRFIALPFAGAYLILAGLDHILLHSLGHLLGVEMSLSGLWEVILLGLFLLGVINFPPFRLQVMRMLQRLGIALRLLFWDIPRWLADWPPIWYLWHWRGLVLFRRYLFLPLVLALLTYTCCQILAAGPFSSGVAVTTATGSGLLLTATREGRILLATVADYVAWSLRYLSVEWIVLSLNWIVDLFRGLVNSLEQLQYRIDEWLRYRGEQNRFQLAMKAVLSLLWSIVAYILRFTVYLLIEPQINPVKHFPVVTVSHKLLLATIPFFSDLVLLGTGMEPTPANRAKAVALVTSVIWAIPGVFGFLAWELKENWRLYAANQSRRLLPVRVGSHGETVSQLLRPGIHSGTLRKLFRRWRRYYEDATGTPAGKLRRLQHQFHHLAQAIQLFVNRNLVFLLQHVPAWRSPLPEVTEVHLGVSTIRTVLGPQKHSQTKQSAILSSDGSAVLRFGLQGGWLVASWEQIGWLGNLPPDQTEILCKALTGLYHWAGVEVVAEQLDQLMRSIASGATHYDQGLVAVADGSFNLSPPNLLRRTCQSESASQTPCLLPSPHSGVVGVQSHSSENPAATTNLHLAWWLTWQGLHLYERATPECQAFYRWQEESRIEPEIFRRWLGHKYPAWLNSSQVTNSPKQGAISWPVLSPQQIWFAASPLSWDTWLGWWS